MDSHEYLPFPLAWLRVSRSEVFISESRGASGTKQKVDLERLEVT